MKKAILLATFVAFFTLFLILGLQSQEETKSTPSRQLNTISSIPRFIMRLMDLNKDGWISEDENKKFFADADQDKDGFISLKEIIDFIDKKIIEASGPNLGQDAPDFALKTLDGKNTIKLSNFKEKDIVVLVFGSYSSPKFRSQAENLEKIYQQYKNKSKWLFIYIKEAYPSDELQKDENVEEGININQPKTMEERLALANEYYKKLGFSFPALVDEMDNNASISYAAQPERLYIVDKRSRIVYKGEKGPDGFDTQKMAETLARLCST